MKNINMNRFRAFGSALDMQQQYNVIRERRTERRNRTNENKL